jgi:hypothetical protein
LYLICIEFVSNLLLRLQFWMDRCNTMKQMIELRNLSASWVARLAGPAARSGLAARLRAAGNQPALEAVSAKFLAALELWWMIEANVCRIQKRKIRNNQR